MPGFTFWRRNQDPYYIDPQTVLDIVKPVAEQVTPGQIQKGYPEAAQEYADDADSFVQKPENQPLAADGLTILVVGILIGIVQNIVSSLITETMRQRVVVITRKVRARHANKTLTPQLLPKFPEPTIRQAVHEALLKVRMTDEARQQLEDELVQSMVRQGNPNERFA